MYCSVYCGPCHYQREQQYVGTLQDVLFDWDLGSAGQFINAMFVVKRNILVC